MPRKDETIKPIGAEFDEVASAMIAPGMKRPNFQIGLPLVQYEIEHEIIYQRVKDGYINATAMCKAAEKLFGHYNSVKAHQEFFAELSADIGIPISELIQAIKGGDPQLQGTWVHPQLAIHLAQWLSPKFAVRVSKGISMSSSTVTGSGIITNPTFFAACFGYINLWIFTASQPPIRIVQTIST